MSKGTKFILFIAASFGIFSARVSAARIVRGEKERGRILSSSKGDKKSLKQQGRTLNGCTMEDITYYNAIWINFVDFHSEATKAAAKDLALTDPPSVDVTSETITDYFDFAEAYFDPDMTFTVTVNDRSVDPFDVVSGVEYPNLDSFLYSGTGDLPAYYQLQGLFFGRFQALNGGMTGSLFCNGDDGTARLIVRTIDTFVSLVGGEDGLVHHEQGLGRATIDFAAPTEDDDMVPRVVDFLVEAELLGTIS